MTSKKKKISNVTVVAAMIKIALVPSPTSEVVLMKKLTGTFNNQLTINQSIKGKIFTLLVVGILIISYSSDSNETPADNMHIVRVFIFKLVGNAFLSDKSWWYLHM